MTSATRGALAALLSLALSGCAAASGCYFGMSLIPPMPVVMCGADLSPDEGDE